MTKIEVKATPEQLVQQAVELDNEGNVMLLEPNGDLLARIAPGNVFMSDVLGAVRGWLVQQIEAGYKAGVEAGRAEGQESIAGRVAAARGDALTAHANELRAALGVTDPWDGCIATVRDLVAKDKAPHGEPWVIKSWASGNGESDVTLRVPDCMASLVMKLGANRQGLRVTVEGIPCVPAVTLPAPTDAAAESAAIDGLIAGAIRQRGNDLDGHDRSGRWCLSLGDTRVDTRRHIADAWLKGWLLAAWARGVAYGQGDISTGESRCAVQLANALGHTSETLPTWEEALALVTRDRQPSPGDFFGMAAREQVAAERAVDAAAVAPSEEDSIRATFVKSEIEGLRNKAEDLDNEVKNLRRSRDSAIAAHKEDQQHAATLREMLGAPADEPWTGILRRVRALRNDYVEVAAMATVMRQDLPGRVAAAVAPSEEAIAAAHEKGRIRGWGEAIDAVKRAHEAESKDEYMAAEEAARLRREADHAEDTRSRLALRAVATGNVLDAVTAAAPKGAP